MRKAVSTVIGSLIFVIIMIAFFGAFFYMQNQLVNFVSSSINTIASNSQKSLEKFDIILSAYDEYLPINVVAPSTESASYSLYDIYKPYDGRYMIVKNSSNLPNVNLLNITYIFSINKAYNNQTYLVLVNLLYDLKIIYCSPQEKTINLSLILSSSGITLVSTTLESESSNPPSCRYIFDTGFTFSTASFQLSNTTFSKKNVPVQIILQVTTKGKNPAYVNATLLIDFISFRISTSPIPNYLNIYVLNNSPFSSSILQIIIFNQTNYIVYNTNIVIPSGVIRLIQIQISSTNFLRNSSIKIVTSYGNGYQSTIYS